MFAYEIGSATVSHDEGTSRADKPRCSARAGCRAWAGCARRAGAAATTLARRSGSASPRSAARARPGRVAAPHARGVAALGATRGDDGMMGARARPRAPRTDRGSSLPAARGAGARWSRAR